MKRKNLGFVKYMTPILIVGVAVLFCCSLAHAYTNRKELFAMYSSVPASLDTPKDKAFTLADNFCHPSCCNARMSGSLSCSHGCVCLKKDQQELLGTRGHNNVHASEY